MLISSVLLIISYEVYSTKCNLTHWLAGKRCARSFRSLINRNPRDHWTSLNTTSETDEGENGNSTVTPSPKLKGHQQQSSSQHLPLNEEHRKLYFGYPSRSIQHPQSDLKMHLQADMLLNRMIHENPRSFLLQLFIRKGLKALVAAESDKARGEIPPGKPFHEEPLQW